MRKKSLARIDRLTASAVLDPRGLAGIIPVRGPGSRPWDLYRKVPELRAGIEWMSNAISRADLHVYKRTINGLELVEDPKITDVLAEMIDTGPSQSDMLKRMVFHLEATGESYLVPHRRNGELIWTVASNEEVRSLGDTTQLQVDIQTWVDVDGAKVIRIWHPDPQFGWFAESPIMAMESILLQIIAINARSIAVNESRLAGNGVIAFPDTLSVVQPASEGSANPIVKTKDFINAFEEAMVAPMTDRGLVSSVVPLLISGPADAIDKIKHIKLSSDLDQRSTEQMEQALRRMAISMALPPEIILGLGETNHWNSFAIVREAIQTAVEPRLDAICSAITDTYLRPKLLSLGINANEYLVGADVNDLVVPPDRSEAAAVARAQGLLTDEAWARYQGFEESDIPAGADRDRITLERVLFAHPEFAPWILPALDIDVPGLTTTDPAALPNPLELEDAEEETPAEDGAPTTALPRPRTEPGAPAISGPPPSAPAGLAASKDTENLEATVITAVESAVLHVLERSNNRILRGKRSHNKETDGVPIIDIHTRIPVTVEMKEHALRGAYTTYEQNMPSIVPIVDQYVNYLYDNGLQHSRDLLTETVRELALYWPEVEPVG